MSNSSYFIENYKDSYYILYYSESSNDQTIVGHIPGNYKNSGSRDYIKIFKHQFKI